VEKGLKRKVKSVFKTCKTLHKNSRLKEEMLDFPKQELKFNAEIFQQVTPKFQELNKDDLSKLNVALTVF